MVSISSPSDHDDHDETDQLNSEELAATDDAINGGNRVLSVAGSGNLFVGVGAGAANTTGTDNAFFGDGAGAKNTTGYGNAFFGHQSGAMNTEGFTNTFFGAFVGGSNDTGFNNAFFGSYAGSINNTGHFNAFFGANAGGTNTTGSRNAFSGDGAGSHNTTGDRNAFFGDSAGFSNTTGSDNTLIGLTADVAVGNLTNATAIGANARVSQSNSMVLGGIFGINGSGNDTAVGIGITAPQFRLHVVDRGAAGLRVQTNSTGGAVASFGGFGDFQIDAANVPSGRFLVREDGRVGIGTTSPDQLLSVNGNASKVGGGSWASFSDERLKNIKGRFMPGLKAVMRLQPLRYEYKRDNALNLKSDGEHIGFTAQPSSR